MQFTADESNHKQRLDRYLVEQLGGYTRSQIKKLIENNNVTVNGRDISVHHFLKTGDSIEVITPAEKVKEEIPELEILAEGNGYIVINKPAGMLAHHANGHEERATVADWLIKHSPEAAEVGDPMRPGIVHRLDRATSGVMILATNQEMFDNLKNQFKNREIKKVYRTLVHEHLPHPEGQVKKFIGRSKKEGRMAARTQAIDENDREAITDYKVIKSYQKYDFVEAYPLTGRTHQIRVHFMAMGTAVVGDKQYKVHGQKKVIDLGRIFLHSAKITFTDLDGKEVSVSSPLPDELTSFLDQLK